MPEGMHRGVRWSYSVIRKLLVLCILNTYCPTAFKVSVCLFVCRSGTVLVKHNFVNVKVNMDIADRCVVAAVLQLLPPRVVWYQCEYANKLYSCSSTTVTLFNVNSNVPISWRRIITWSLYFFLERSMIIQLKSNFILWKHNFHHCHNKSPTPNSVLNVVSPVNIFIINLFKIRGLRAGRPGFDSRQGREIFLCYIASRPPLEPTQPPIQWVSEASSCGSKAAGAWT
jgi:hypothetical protein